MNHLITPELAELRKCIDHYDQQLAHLLCQRLLLVKQIAPLKPDLASIRVEARIEEIIHRVIPIADEYGINRQFLETIFRHLIDECGQQEHDFWLKMQSNQKK